MKYASEHIPPQIMQNAPVEQFAKVIDGMIDKRDESLLVFENMLNPFTAKLPASLKSFLFEAGQLPRLTDVPMFLIERLILNAKQLFGIKGTPDGLTKFAWATVDGTVQNIIAKIRVQEHLQPGDIGGFGYLPDGNDLGIAVSAPERFPFLFGGAMSLYYGYIKFRLNSDYIASHRSRVELMQWLPEFLPMATPGSTSITVDFYTITGNTFLETLNI